MIVCAFEIQLYSSNSNRNSNSSGGSSSSESDGGTPVHVCVRVLAAAAVVARHGAAWPRCGLPWRGRDSRSAATWNQGHAYAARRFSACVTLFITAAVGAQAATLCRPRRSQPESRYSRPDIILLYLRSERRG